MNIPYCSVEKDYTTDCPNYPRGCPATILFDNFPCDEAFLPNFIFGVTRIAGPTGPNGENVDDYTIKLINPNSSNVYVQFNLQITYGAVPVGKFILNDYGATFFMTTTGYGPQGVYPFANATYVRITPSLIPRSVLRRTYYNQTDEYDFHLVSNGLTSASLILARNPALAIAVNDMSTQLTTINSTMIPKSCLSCQDSINKSQQCECIETPEVLARIQTTIDGSDINQAIFTILDKYTYYEEVPLVSHCNTNQIERCKVKETVFDRCCPFIVSITRGRGPTLQDKAMYIWNKYPPGIRFEQFYMNLIIFAMARYIFARILYGCFNIELILGRYYDEFLIDLGKSRFCRFIPFFTEGYIKGYNKYIKY